jgi:electron transport complex protein RnfE
MDGLGMGIGFAFALFSIGAVREIFGAGSLFGMQLFHDGFQDWVVMVLPSGGFFTLAGWLMLFNWIKQRGDKRAETAAVTLSEEAAR